MRKSDLIYALLFYLFAGALTGAVFKVRCLLLILLFVLGQAISLALEGTLLAAGGAVVGLVAVQAGYLLGLVSRAMFALAGHYYAVR